MLDKIEVFIGNNLLWLMFILSLFEYWYTLGITCLCVLITVILNPGKRRLVIQ